MFEAVQDKKDASTSRLWVSMLIVVVLAVVGTVIYMMSKGPAKGPASGAAAVAAPTNADAVKDLKIVRATMGKDRDGMTALWSVTLENKSETYTYSGIRYEASYIGADNAPVLVNRGGRPRVPPAPVEEDAAAARKPFKRRGGPRSPWPGRIGSSARSGSYALSEG